MPLKLDQNEGVAREERRCLHAGLARRRYALNAESRQVDLKAAQTETV
jgi:hypothetical protein